MLYHRSPGDQDLAAAVDALGWLNERAGTAARQPAGHGTQVSAS